MSFSLHSRPALTLGGDALAADTSPREHTRASRRCHPPPPPPPDAAAHSCGWARCPSDSTPTKSPRVHRPRRPRPTRRRAQAEHVPRGRRGRPGRVRARRLCIRDGRGDRADAVRRSVIPGAGRIDDDDIIGRVRVSFKTSGGDAAQKGGRVQAIRQHVGTRRRVIG